MTYRRGCLPGARRARGCDSGQRRPSANVSDLLTQKPLEVECFLQKINDRLHATELSGNRFGCCRAMRPPSALHFTRKSAVSGNLIKPPRKNLLRNAYLIVLAILQGSVSMSFLNRFARQPRACITTDCGVLARDRGRRFRLTQDDKCLKGSFST